MRISLLLCAIFLLLGCKKKEKTDDSYFKGTLTIAADGSFASVTEALANGYMMAYPEAKIQVETKKEDIAFLELLQKKSNIIVMSRDLTALEKKEYERIIDLPFQPAKFAADAVLFVVPKDSPISEISYSDIEKDLLSNNKKFIFDGTNSSNLNFVAQKLKKKPSELSFSVLDSNVAVINELSKFPDKIGVISLNTISRPYSKEAEVLRSKVKILSVTQNGKSYQPDFKNLSSLAYPFTRILYFLTSDGTFSMANGFIRYSCTQLGQIIVQKEGLQKYNLYGREVQMR